MYYILYFFLDKLALHVLGAICTHHQEHNCSVQPLVLYLWKTEVLVSSGVGVLFYFLCMNVLWIESASRLFHCTDCLSVFLKAPYNKPQRAQRRSWCIALHILDLGPLYPRERPGTHCTGGWVGPRAGLYMCEKSRPHQDFFCRILCLIVLVLDLQLSFVSFVSCRTACCGFFQQEKSDGFGRERTRDLGDSIPGPFSP
jgi:hypothetical protein